MIEFAGFVAWVALWQTRRHGRAGRGLVAAATVLLIVSLVIMGRAANLGGEIRHPEIRAGAAARPVVPHRREKVDGTEQFVAAAISQFVVYSTWAWPAAETVHFLGLSLSFGVLLAVNLRILGVMRQVPFADVHRLLPWGMLGFGANLITGMMFFVGQPGQYVGNVPFYWKVVFLMIAGANFLYLTVFRNVWAADGSSRASPTRPWRSRPSRRGSSCCTRAGCCPSSATPSDGRHRLRKRSDQFFKAAVQLRTTVIRAEGGSPSGMLMRNRPSGDTS